MFDSNYLLIDEEPLTATVTGETYKRHWLRDVPFIMELAVTGTITGTSPTLDVKLQVSDDDSTWTDFYSFTQVTTSPVVERHRFLTGKKYIRAVATAGGTSPSFGKVQFGLIPAGEYMDPVE